MDEFKFGDVEVNADFSYIRLEKNPSKFSFRLKSDDSNAEGYCDLTEEEYKVFNAVFKRMVNNVERVD